MPEEPKPVHVFISHFHKDEGLATAFATLLEKLSSGLLKSLFSSDQRSEHGFETGKEWYPQIKEALTNSADVVCLLTPSSAYRPWMLFEAGMAIGMGEKLVHGITLKTEMGKMEGPFSLLHHCSGNKEALTHLLHQLFKRIPSIHPHPELIGEEVDKFVALVDRTVSPSNVAPNSDAIRAAAIFLLNQLKDDLKVMPSEAQVFALQHVKQALVRISRSLDRIIAQCYLYAQDDANQPDLSRAHLQYIRDTAFSAQQAMNEEILIRSWSDLGIQEADAQKYNKDRENVVASFESLHQAIETFDHQGMIEDAGRARNSIEDMMCCLVKVTNTIIEKFSKAVLRIRNTNL